MTDRSPHYHLVPKEIGANLRFRRKLLIQAAEEPEFAAQLRGMCRHDLLFYVNAFCWTYDPRSRVKVTPFITYPEFQDEAMLSLEQCVHEGRDAAMPKSRDMGASWMGLTVFEWLWHFRRDLSFLLVSRNEDYVDKRGNPKSLFWKIDFLHKHQPNWLLPEGRWLGDRDPGRKKLSLVNADTNSVIDGESTTGDAGRGDRRTAMFIDEHAAFELTDGFKLLRATRDTTNCRVFNSTPQGANTAFYEVVHKTAAKILRLHWSSHPAKSVGLYTTDAKTGRVVLLDDWRGEVTLRPKDGAEKTVVFPEQYPFRLDADDPRVRSPWYDNQCDRCVSPQEVAQELDIDFLGSAYPFFDPKFILLLVKTYCRPEITRGDLEFDRETLTPKRFTPGAKGKIRLWIQLDGAWVPPKDMKFSAGVDISAGTGASNSVLTLACRKTGEKVAVMSTPNMRPHGWAELCIAVCRWFNNAYLAWDASGPTGAVFTKKVIESTYGNIYYRRYEKKVTQEQSKEPGYYLNPQARATLLEDYRAALADRKFINRSESGMNECGQFVRRPDGGIEHSASANAQDPSGARTAHGDEVIADALCCLGVMEHQVVERAKEPEKPVGSLAWRRSRREADMERVRDMKQGLGEGW